MRIWTREASYRYLTDPGELESLHRKTASSVWRQHFHNQPVTGLLNDPNGFACFDGAWHLFYQWCPWGAVHGLKYWYHIISHDLVSWKNLGVCLCPGLGDAFDNRGVYSGSAMPAGDTLLLYYTGNHRDLDWTRRPCTCLARLDRNGHAEKAPAPLFGAHPDYTEHQRDPKILYDPGTQAWHILLGAQTRDGDGCILVYSSQSPVDGWTFAGQLKVTGYEHFGSMWECPSMEHISGRDVLIFCPQQLTLPSRATCRDHCGYLLGTMDWASLVFTPESPFTVLDAGFDFYAAAGAAGLPGSDRAVVIGWMGLPNASYPTDEEDWSGCLSLPRELTLRNGQLIQRPLPEMKKLRNEQLTPVPNHAGCFSLPLCAELEMDWDSSDLDMALFTDAQGQGGFMLRYDTANHTFFADRGGMEHVSSPDMGTARTCRLENGLHRLHMFIDSSSLEIFVNDGEAVLSSRVFPAHKEHFFRTDMNASLRLWALAPAVEDRFLV